MGAGRGEQPPSAPMPLYDGVNPPKESVVSSTPQNPGAERPENYDEPADQTSSQEAFSDPETTSSAARDEVTPTTQGQGDTPPAFPGSSRPAADSAAPGSAGAPPFWKPDSAGPVPPVGGPGQPPFGGPGQPPYGRPPQPPYGQAPVGAPYGAPGSYPPPPVGPGQRAAAPLPRPGQVGPHGLSLNEERVHASTAHWLAILAGVTAPLAFYLADGPWSPFVKENARRSLNFELTLLIAYIVSSLLMTVFIGFVLFPLVWICSIIFHVLGATAANRGEVYKYPVSAEFVK